MSGMGIMGESTPLCIKDISAIIKISGLSGVAELKFGALELKFHPPGAHRNEAAQIQQIDMRIEPSRLDSDAFDGEKVALEAKRAAEEELEELEKIQTLITNPFEHENSMIEEASLNRE